VKKIALVLPALAAGIMMMVAAAPASAQPAPPQLPTEPPVEAPPVPDMPNDTARPASKVAGTTARWTRSTRTLRVNVSCVRSGAVILSRGGNRIGRKAFDCSVGRTKTVPVRITRAANRHLDVGDNVRARVNTGSQHHSKLLRVVRATAANARVAALATTAASDFLGCSVGTYGPWYAQNKYANLWQGNGAWWEAWCAYEGLVVSSGIGKKWDYFFYNGSYAQLYGTWEWHALDGSWRWWDVANGRYYCPWGGFC
jgi:hypothetical protein